jgi:predicted amidohydrolase YtcJ
LKGSIMADILIRAARIYSMAPDRVTYRSIAIRDGVILGLSQSVDGVDDLAGPGAKVIDDQSLIVLPAFIDDHNHLLQVARSAAFVQIDKAQSIPEIIDLLRARAAVTEPGQWIQTSTGWNEQNLAERRLPTASDLDQATTKHPVVARRGGHMAIVNSQGLRLSGINADTPDPAGGHLGHGENGTPNGILEGGAQYVLLHVPPPTVEEQIAGLREVCQSFSAAGIGTVRDPAASPEGVQVYRTAAARGVLSLRSRPMLLVFPSGSVEERVAQVHAFGPPGGGDEWVRTWGLKFVMDGGPEGGALDQPYSNDPSNLGHLNWEPEDFFAVANASVERGWRIGTHAIGDRAVRTVLDAYEKIVAANPGLPAGTLAIEHAFLAEQTQRSRAVAMGVRITVQHALLWQLATNLIQYWGPERTRNVMPVRAWLEENALLSAGTDYPIGFFEPVRSICGMVTRQTKEQGVQGPEYAIERYDAARLCTVAGASLIDESNRLGMLSPGLLADIVAFHTDPLTCSVDDLPGLKPALTMVGGSAVYDPEGVAANQAPARTEE